MLVSCFDSVKSLTAKMPLSFAEANFIGTVLEGVFYGNRLYLWCLMPQFISSLGLYCVIFILYLRIHTSKKCADRSPLIYPISSLFILCTTFFVLDFTQEYLMVVSMISSTSPWRWINAHKPPGEGTWKKQPSSMESEPMYKYNLFFCRCHCSRGSGTS